MARRTQTYAIRLAVEGGGPGQGRAGLGRQAELLRAGRAGGTLVSRACWHGPHDDTP
jgi:hypothetical protein